MKILFMGTPEPAAESLKALIEAKEEIVAVITQPDRPKGRGLKLSPSPVKAVASTYNIPVHQPEKIKDIEAIKAIKAIKADLIVVVAFGKILPKEIIEAPRFGSINVHASLLPKYRGAAPVQWALMNGDSETGITIQRVAEELDSGDIILQKKVPIDMSDNTGTLMDKLFEAGSKLLVEAVGQIKSGTAKYSKQDEKKVTYAPMLTKETGAIDWKWDAKRIFNLIRACDPWPVAYTTFNGKMLRIFWADVMDRRSDAPGKVKEIVGDKGFIIGTGDRDLLIRDVQMEGGRRMSAKDFLAGHKINVGAILPE